MKDFRKIAKLTLIFTIFTLLSKLFGFLREVLIAYQFGASYQSDAYKVASSYPYLVFSILSYVILVVFLPMYIDIKNSKSKEEADGFVSNFLNIILLISTIISVLSYAFAAPIIHVLAPGFTGDTFTLTVGLTRIMASVIVFISFVAVCNGFLEANEKFFIPSIIALPQSLSIILSIIMITDINAVQLSLATGFGVILQSIVCLYGIYKHGFRYRFKLKLNDDNIIRLLKLSLPAIIGVSVYQLNLIVDRIFASGLVEGSISALDYSSKVSNLVYSIFIVSILTIIFPNLSNLYSRKLYEDFFSTLIKMLNIIIYLVFPMMMGLIIFSEEITKIIFFRGSFDIGDLNMTSAALIFYSIGLVSLGVRELLNRAFYAFQDTKTPMNNGAICAIINILLNFILVRVMSYKGLALATSISYIVSSIMLLVILKRRFRDIKYYPLLKSLAKAAIASSVMGIVSIGINDFVLLKVFHGAGNAASVSFLITIVLAALIYAVVLLLLKVEEINDLINYIRNRKRAA